jgi:hypothetical protein
LERLTHDLSLLSSSAAEYSGMRSLHSLIVFVDFDLEKHNKRSKVKFIYIINKYMHITLSPKD